MEGLFAEIAGPAVTRSGGSARDQRPEKAWELWSDLTSRPDRSTPDRKFLLAYRGHLKANRRQEDLLRVVEAAARTPIRPRDPLDTRRVLMALSTPAHERVALSCLREGKPIIDFPREEVTELCSISDVEAACGTPRTTWTSQHLEAAGILMGTLDAHQVEVAAEAVALRLGQKVLMPMDVLRNLSVVKDGKVAIVKSRDSYDSGANESDAYTDTFIDLDLGAEKMRLQGARTADVLRYHHLAPEGYWKAVGDYLDANRASSFSQAYAAMKPEFSFHPDDRNTP